MKNRLNMKSAITGEGPVMEPYSTTDDNVDLNIKSKGTGDIIQTADKSLV